MNNQVLQQRMAELQLIRLRRMYISRRDTISDTELILIGGSGVWQRFGYARFADFLIFDILCDVKRTAALESAMEMGGKTNERN